MLYGAAEFSRDTDIVLVAEPDNARRLSAALDELRAERIAVPPFELDYLNRGHAVHFRCQHPDARRMRIDAMAVLRGVPSFPTLWERRTTVEVDSGVVYDLLSLPDLVLAKKTQRDKDWLMARRLVLTHYAQHREDPAPEHVDFWLREGRDVPLLVEVAQTFADRLPAQLEARPLLALAKSGDPDDLAVALKEEEEGERRADIAYWRPLREELDRLRRSRRP